MPPRRIRLWGAFVGLASFSGSVQAQECVQLRPTDPESRYPYGAADAASFATGGDDFRIWYAESGPHAPAGVEAGQVPDAAQRSAGVLAQAAAFFRDSLGFVAPLSDRGYPECSSNGGDSLLDAYLVDFQGADGSIELELCSETQPRTCSGFMLIDHRFAHYADFDTGARTVLPHEYFHLVQAAYTVPMATWWSEATAQWATSQLHPDLGDMESYFAAYLDNVDRPIDLPPATAAQPFSYATALFVVYLTEAFDTDVVRDVFEVMAEQGLGELDALDSVLSARDSSLGSAFAEFARWNAATGARAGRGGYREASRYPEVSLVSLSSTELAQGVSGSTSGFSANYFLLEVEGEIAVDITTDPTRSRAYFVPFESGTLELQAAVSLPGEVQGPGVIVISGATPDKRDAPYRLREAPLEASDDVRDGGTSGASDKPSEGSDPGPSLNSESGCALVGTSRGSTAALWAWWIVAFMSLGRRRRAAVSLLGLGLGIGCADAPADGGVGIAQQAIMDGAEDRDHDAVFRLLSRKDGLTGLCSGVLIAPDLVLTARHCVSETPGGLVECGKYPFGDTLAPDGLLLSNAVRPNLDSRWYATREVLVPRVKADLCGADIALLHLDEPVPGNVAEPYTPLLDASVDSGMRYAALGYGNTDDGPESTFGERRVLSDLKVACGTEACPDPVAPSEFVGEQGVCSGDSGGPALGVGNIVLGVASRGGADCTTPVYAGLGAFEAWLISEAERAAAAGEYARPGWLPALPDDTQKQAESDQPAIVDEAEATALPSEGCSLSQGLPRERGVPLEPALLIGAAALLARRHG